MIVNERECEAAGLDPKEVDRIARGLTRYAKQAQALGLTVFGGSSNGSLRYADDGIDDRALVVADGLGNNFDGGDGATNYDEDGLLRGE